MNIPLRLLRWVQEYSLSLGIILCIATIILIQNRTAMATLLIAGVAFLAISLIAAVEGPVPTL